MSFFPYSNLNVYGLSRLLAAQTTTTGTTPVYK